MKWDRHAQTIPGVEFSGPKFFLSNFYTHPVVYDGQEYASGEHAFQAQKAVHPADVMLVRMASDPAQAKRIGKAIQRIRPDWDNVKVEIMLGVVRAKFRDPALQEKLLATGDEVLVEHNTWKDRFWGVWQGRGENNLGKILMQVRQEVRDAHSRHDAALPWIE